MAFVLSNRFRTIKNKIAPPISCGREESRIVLRLRLFYSLRRHVLQTRASSEFTSSIRSMTMSFFMFWAFRRICSMVISWLSHASQTSELEAVQLRLTCLPPSSLFLFFLVAFKCNVFTRTEKNSLPWGSLFGLNFVSRSVLWFPQWLGSNRYLPKWGQNSLVDYFFRPATSIHNKRMLSFDSVPILIIPLTHQL